MSSQSQSKENKENDLLDMIIGTTVATAFFMGIALVAGIISFLVH